MSNNIPIGIKSYYNIPSRSSDSPQIEISSTNTNVVASYSVSSSTGGCFTFDTTPVFQSNSSLNIIQLDTTSGYPAQKIYLKKGVYKVTYCLNIRCLAGARIESSLSLGDANIIVETTSKATIDENSTSGTFANCCILNITTSDNYFVINDPGTIYVSGSVIIEKLS